MAQPSAVPRSGSEPTPILHSAAARTEPRALEVEDLYKSYGALQAVAGIHFHIDEGEVFGLLGPNGAGKTSTISVLATMLRPSAGDARVFGHSVCKEVDAVRAAIGIVPQEISLYPRLTARENVRFFGRMYNVKPPEVDRRVDELLELVGLETRRNDYVETFSGGMKRRLNLAVSLVHRPSLLLLDEPTVGVDPHSRERIFDIVRYLRADGTAILYTTHYMEEAELLCDRLGIMDEGKIIAMGRLDDLLAQTGCAEIIEVRGLDGADRLRRLEAHPDVCRLENDGGVARLFVTNATHLLGPLEQAIGSRSEGISIEIAPMRLSSLFLSLTGKQLRD